MPKVITWKVALKTRGFGFVFFFRKTNSYGTVAAVKWHLWLYEVDIIS